MVCGAALSCELGHQSIELLYLLKIPTRDIVEFPFTDSLQKMPKCWEPEPRIRGSGYSWLPHTDTASKKCLSVGSPSLGSEARGATTQGFMFQNLSEF